MNMQVAALDILTTKGGFTPAAARAIGEALDLPELHQFSMHTRLRLA